MLRCHSSWHGIMHSWRPYPILIQAAATRDINLTVTGKDRSYKLLEGRSFSTTEFLQYHVDGNTCKLPHQVWKHLRWHLSYPEKPFKEEKGFWTILVLDAVANMDVYQQKLVYPDSHQKPISYAHYCTPFFQQWGWLPFNLEDWHTLAADISGDMDFEWAAIVLRKKWEGDIQCHYFEDPTRAVFASPKLVEWREFGSNQLKDSRRHLDELDSSSHTETSKDINRRRERLSEEIMNYEKWDTDRKTRWSYEPIPRAPAELSSFCSHSGPKSASNGEDGSSPGLHAIHADEGGLQVVHNVATGSAEAMSQTSQADFELFGSGQIRFGSRTAQLARAEGRNSHIWRKICSEKRKV